LQKQAYNAPKRIEKLEKLMEDLEVKVAAIDEEMLTNGSNVEKLMSLTHQREELQDKIDDYMREWEELEELLMSMT
jgi:polysaccharide pyruvyl transferase WcaK-like protein